VFTLTYATGAIVELAEGKDMAYRASAGIGADLLGRVSAIPLLFFAAAANRLDLQILGLMHWFNPTMQVSLAIFLLGEQMLPGQGVTFSLIWLGLALYSVLPRLRHLRR